MWESFRSDVSDLLFQMSAFPVIILKVVMTTPRVPMKTRQKDTVSVTKNHDAETASMSAKISAFAVLWVIL